MKKSEEEKRQAIKQIREDAKEFATHKHFFDRKHYDILIHKSLAVKEAEALYQRQAVKDEALESLAEAVDDVLRVVESLAIDNNN
jgi:hypothetical protein